MSLSGYEQDDEGGWAHTPDVDSEDDNFSTFEADVKIEEEEENNVFCDIDWDECSWHTQDFQMMENKTDFDDDISIITQEDIKFNN